jgi:hypothetical protein
MLTLHATITLSPWVLYKYKGASSEHAASEAADTIRAENKFKATVGVSSAGDAYSGSSA